MQLYAQIKHEILFGKVKGFEDNVYEMNNLFYDYCPSYNTPSYPYNEKDYYEIVIPADEFKILIRLLEIWSDAHFEFYIRDSKWTREKTIELFKKLYDEADKRDGNIRLNWRED